MNWTGIREKGRAARDRDVKQKKWRAANNMDAKLQLGILTLKSNNQFVIVTEAYEFVVAEAYTTQPNSKASSRVLYMYFSCMAG